MGVASPDLMAGAFTEMFNVRDREGLRDLFEKDSVFTLDGEAVAVGLEQVFGALNGFLDTPVRFKGAYVSCYVAGDTALMRMKWQLHNEQNDNLTEGISTDVLRRGADGK